MGTKAAAVNIGGEMGLRDASSEVLGAIVDIQKALIGMGF